MEDFVNAIKKYADFNGRTSKKEFWNFVLIYTVIYLILEFLSGVSALDGNGFFLLNIISGLFFLFTLLPGLSISVRRLHDTNRSGWWMWLCLLPLIGPIVLMVFFALSGTEGENRYGPDSRLPVNVIPPVSPLNTNQ